MSNELNCKNIILLEKLIESRFNLPLWGVSPAEPLRETINEELISTFDRYTHAVVIGYPLSRGVLETIENSPNILYKHHYQQVNWYLDRCALEIATEIESHGYLAIPIPASVITDWDCQRGHLSHRHSAVNAGLGWLGRHGLVVTEEFGAQIRWATILTDMELPTGTPIDGDCGSCMRCVEACPVEAIGISFCDVRSCYEQLKEYSKIPGVGQLICGICIKACSSEHNG